MQSRKNCYHSIYYSYRIFSITTIIGIFCALLFAHPTYGTSENKCQQSFDNPAPTDETKESAIQPSHTPQKPINIEHIHDRSIVLRNKITYLLQKLKSTYPSNAEQINPWDHKLDQIIAEGETMKRSILQELKRSNRKDNEQTRQLINTLNHIHQNNLWILFNR